MTQGPKGLRGPTAVPSGGVLVVDVANGATSVEVGEMGGGPVTSYPVGPDGKARIPVEWEGGALLFVSTGRWPSLEAIPCEVISTLR